MCSAGSQLVPAAVTGSLDDFAENHGFHVLPNSPFQVKNTHLSEIHLLSENNNREKWKLKPCQMKTEIMTSENNTN